MAAFIALLGETRKAETDEGPRQRGNWNQTKGAEMEMSAMSNAPAASYNIPVQKNPNHLRSDFERAIHKLLPVQEEEGLETGEDKFDYYDEHGLRNWDFLGSFIPQIRFRDVLQDDDQNDVLVAEQCWEQVTKFLKKHHYEVLYGILHIIVFKLRDTPKSLEMYKKLIDLSRLEDKSYDMLGQCIVECSKYPMTTALLLSDWYRECADIRLSMVDEFEDMQKRYTQAALELLHDLDSDQLATMMLHVPTDFGRKITALSVAIERQNIDFVSDSRVVRIMGAIWSNHDLMNPNKQYKSTVPSPFSIMNASPHQFYRLPIGKFNVQVFLYLFYAICFSALTIMRPSLWAEIGPIEWLFWFSNLGFVIQEITECMQSGWAMYLLDWSNYLDMVMVCNFLALMVIRYTANECTLDLDPEDPECWAYQENQKFVFYRMFWSINAVFVWVRCTYFLSMHKTLGPLIKMMVKMMDDLFNFFMVIIFFFIGFVFAFNYYVGHIMEDSYGNLEESFITVYRATIEGYEFANFNVENNEGMTPLRSNLALMLMVIYVVLTGFILLNILIAMMATTFSEVYSMARLQFVYGSAFVIYTNDKLSAVMPPPLNMLAYILWSLWFLMRVLKVTAAGRKKTGDKEFDEGGFKSTVIQAAQGDPTVWYCQHCHHPNEITDEGNREKSAVVAWFDQFDVRCAAKEQKKVEDSGVEVCNNCWRPKRRGTWARLMLEKISFIVFVSTIALPLWIILAMPGFMEKFTDSIGMTDGGDGDTVEDLLETYKEIPGSGGNMDVQQVFDDLNEVNQSEVAKKIEEVERTTNNIHNLAGRLIRSKA